jgi:hypothetical protein
MYERAATAIRASGKYLTSPLYSGIFFRAFASVGSPIFRDALADGPHKAVLSGPLAVSLLVELGTPVVGGEEDSKIEPRILFTDRVKLGSISGGEIPFGFDQERGAAGSLNIKVRCIKPPLSDFCTVAKSALASPYGKQI